MSKTETITIDVAPASPAPEPTGLALAIAANERHTTQLFRLAKELAKDDGVTGDKLNAALTFLERGRALQAKADFEAAFSAMHPRLPVVTRKGKILNKGGITVRTRYARLEDIQAAVEPVLQEFGFTIRHRVSYPTEHPGQILITGILTHVSGHSETSDFLTPPDVNEYRTPIQDHGSARSFGRRYTTIDLLNIRVEGMDTDGAKEAQVQSDERPVATHAHTDTPITEPQRKRLYAITKRANRTPAEVSTWLLARYGYKEAADITRRNYDAICKFVEAPGQLPLPQEPAQ